MRRELIIGTAILAFATPAAAADPASGYANAADIRAEVAAMERDLKPGQGFMWRPLVGRDKAIAALEYWTKPGRPAVHPDEAEYATVVAGSGTLVSGGTMVAPHETRPGLVEGDRIEGGTTRQLRPGDVFMIPSGVPHWFGINHGKLVLLGTKLSQPPR